MATAYCTTADVTARAALLEPDITAGVIPAATVTAAIAAASDEVRTRYLLNYTVAVIDGYSPTFPPDIVSLAASLAVVELLKWVGPIGRSSADATSAMLDRDIARLTNILRVGALVDDAGELVPGASGTAYGVGSTSRSVTTATLLDEVYADGPRSYPY